MPVFNRKPLAAMVVMLSLWPGAKAMANDFSLQDNQIEVDGVGAVSLASTGQLDTINATINDPVPGNIPDIDFTLVNNNTSSGQYDVRLGLVIQQQGSSNRLESVLGVVRVTVNGSGDITSIDLLNTEELTVIIRRNNATLTYTNDADIGVIQTAGANVTISASAINNALANANPIIADMISALTLSGHYNYRIAMQPVEGSFRVGTTNNDNNLSPLARMQTTCDLDGMSTSSYSFPLGLAGSFSSAYAVHGILSLGGATSPASGFSPLTENCDDSIPGPVEPLPIQAVTNANENAVAGLARAQEAIDSGNSNAVRDEVRDAVENLREALDLLNEQREEEGSANKVQLMALVETFGSLGETIATAQELPDTDAFEEVEDLNEDLLDLLQLITDKVETLTLSDKASIEETITQTLAANDGALEDEDDQTLLRQRKFQLELVLQTQAEVGIDISENQADQQREINGKLLQSLVSNVNPFTRLLIAPVNNTDSPIFGEKFRNFMVNTNTPGSQALTIPDEPGAIRDADGLITARGEDGRVFRYQFTAAAFVPGDAMEDGLYNAPNGALYSVDDGVVIEFAAAPANLQALEDSIADMGFSAALEGPGIVNITLDNGEHVSAAYRFEDLAESTGECANITFVPPTGHPASTDYVFKAQCNNGINQTLVPVVLEQALYATIANSSLTVHNSRDTGYLEVEGVGVFRPDFFVYPLTAEDRNFLNANVNQEGVALQAGDFDGNGTTDYRVLSARGKQTLWGR